MKSIDVNPRGLALSAAPETASLRHACLSGPTLSTSSSSVAQGNSNARAWFGNHALVKYDGKYYDPSYGNGPYNSKIEWEDDSLERFGGIVVALEVVKPSPLTTSVRGEHLWNDKADTKGTPETNINP